MFCPNCGEANNEVSKFCFACGTSLKPRPDLEIEPIKEEKGVSDPTSDSAEAAPERSTKVASDTTEEVLETKLSQQRCPSCGKYYGADDRYCDVDGAKLEGHFGIGSITRPAEISSPSIAQVGKAVIQTDNSAAIPEEQRSAEQSSGGQKVEPSTEISEDQSSKLDQMMACPTCGRSYSTDVSFCEDDGTFLDSTDTKEIEVEPAFEHQGSVEDIADLDAYEDVKKRNYVMSAIAIFLVLFAVFAGAGYAYWTGIIGDRPDQIAIEMEQRLSNEGFAEIGVVVDRDWTATLTGTANGSDDHAKILTIVNSDSNISAIKDQIAVISTREEQLAAIREALIGADLANLLPSIQPGNIVAVGGVLENENEALALKKLIAKPIKGAAIKDITVRSRRWRERDINEALSAAGLGQVRANMLSDTAAELSGSVTDGGDIEKAINLAVANGAPEVRNKIVVRQASLQRTSPTASQEVAAAKAVNAQHSNSPQSGKINSQGIGAFMGTRQARFQNGMASWVGVLSISGSDVGAIIGQSTYGFDEGGRMTRVKCSFNLILQEIEGQRMIVEEQKVKGALQCPGNKRIILTRRGGSGLFGQWLRKKNGTVAYQAELR
jgi:uncharacterized OB-fold protein